MKKMSTNPRSKAKQSIRPRRSKRPAQQAGPETPTPYNHHIPAALMDALRDAVVNVAQQLVEDEVTQLVGAPWSREGDSTLRLGGRCQSRVFLDGEPAHINRPRVRDLASGAEHPLEAVKALASRDALGEDVRRLLVRGVRTRNYDPALGTLADGLGLKMGAVSSAFQRASREDLDALNGRTLSRYLLGRGKI